MPPGYERQATLNLSKHLPAQIGLSAGALVLFVGAGWLVFQLAPLLRPGLGAVSFAIGGPADLLVFLAAAAALTAVMVVLHEAIHGLLFWRFTGDRPTVGYKDLYAYTAAPACYLPRGLYVAIARAPLLTITMAGLLLMVVVPEATLLPVMYVMTLINWRVDRRPGSGRVGAPPADWNAGGGRWRPGDTLPTERACRRYIAAHRTVAEQPAIGAGDGRRPS